MSEADTLDEFIDEIRKHTPNSQARDVGNQQQAGEYIKAVLRVMSNYISEGEIQHIKEQLTERLAAALFDEV